MRPPHRIGLPILVFSFCFPLLATQAAEGQINEAGIDDDYTESVAPDMDGVLLDEDLDDQAEASLSEPVLSVPDPSGGSRHAQRRAQGTAGSEEPGFTAPRQNHVGPLVISEVFPQNEVVLAYRKRLLANREQQRWIFGALERARPYSHFIRMAIERHGMPPELYYLPIIESMYRINARSRSGALGLWQFMKNSIGDWMRITEWVDERKDFWKSTEAAMEKLAHNHRVTGDWLLALAAYNCGLGRLTRTMAQSGIRDFWQLRERNLLPRETREYVPRFLAVAWFAAHAGRHGREPAWEEPWHWERVQLSAPVDLRLLAAAASIPYETLRLGNAELVSSVTPPGSGHKLKVPSRYADALREAVRTGGTQLIRYVLHTVASGDTLFALSRHFDVPVSMLERYNPGVRAGSLQIGTRLVVPLVRETGPFIRPAAAADGPAFENSYVVRPGDTLWSISRAFSTTVARLAAANGLSETSMIRPGQNLKVP